MKAVIMAGGRGTRIAALAGDLPKPMLPIDGRPVLERELGSLREQGVTDVLITVGHLAPVIMEYFGAADARRRRAGPSASTSSILWRKSRWGMRARCSASGTGWTKIFCC